MRSRITLGEVSSSFAKSCAGGKPDAGVDEAVDGVDVRPGGERQHGDEHDVGQHYGVIGRESGVRRHPAEPGQAEDRLDNDQSAERDRNEGIEEPDDRDERVSQRVLECTLASPTPLAASRTHVIIGQNVNQCIAQIAGQDQRGRPAGWRWASVAFSQSMRVDSKENQRRSQFANSSFPTKLCRHCGNKADCQICDIPLDTRYLFL